MILSEHVDSGLGWMFLQLIRVYFERDVFGSIEGIGICKKMLFEQQKMLKR